MEHGSGESENASRNPSADTASGKAAGRGKTGALGWIVGLILVGGLAPVVGYWLLLGRLPTVSSREAVARLQEGRAAVLVDVRPQGAYAAGHLDGAVSWPLDRVLELGQPADLPPVLRDKTLLVVCDVGVSSGRAVAHLTSLGMERVWNVRGGYQEWVRTAVAEMAPCGRPTPETMAAWLHDPPPPEEKPFDRWQAGTGGTGPRWFRPSPVMEQGVSVLSFFFVKPIYTLLSLVVVIVLWKKTEPDLAALRWGMIFFFLGENACAVSYLFFKEASYLWEYLHSYGMLLCFAFTAFALIEAIDRRVLLLSDPQRPCAAIGLCGQCVKHAAVPCRLRRLAYVLLPVLAALAWMLLLADWHNTSYITVVFGHYYHYAHLWVYQAFEQIYCGVLAMLFYGVATVLAVLDGLPETEFQDESRIRGAVGAEGNRAGVGLGAKISFAVASGAMGFGMLRTALGSLFDQNRVWYLFWEEATEFLLIAAVLFVLWNFPRLVKNDVVTDCSK